MDPLRSFRRNAVHVRHALELLQQSTGKVQVDGGYLQDAGLVERYKRLSIPVRRALSPTDSASFDKALDALAAAPGVAGKDAERLAGEWRALQQEIDKPIQLGGSRVPRRQILADWLAAAAFYDTLDKDRQYDRVIDRYGKAAESLGADLTESCAKLVIVLDEAIAAALGEPVILPPPQKTPPPPPDPKEPLWRRLFGKNSS
jgi:hypothetical protein